MQATFKDQMISLYTKDVKYYKDLLIEKIHPAIDAWKE